MTRRIARLVVATCQFPVSGDPRRNLRWVERQMRAARARGAHVAHFPECALSGYAGPDLASYDGYDWDVLRAACERVLELARELRLWAVLGSAHRLSGRSGPDDCSGLVSFAFSHAYLFGQGLTPGTKVYSQGWFRDPAVFGWGAGVSTALAFEVAP